MSVSKEAFKATNLKLREACNDLICAVEENPHAFKDVKMAPKPHVYKPLPSSYRHLGIIGIACTGIMKLLGMGLH